jgi:hypothetical protein
MGYNSMLNSLQDQITELEETVDYSVKVPNIRRSLDAYNLEAAKKRLIGVCYNDFSDNYGNILRMEQGKDFIDVYGEKQDINGKQMFARYYIQQSSHRNLFTGKYSYRYCTFSSQYQCHFYCF